jgi:hypothetical protein
MRKKEKKFTEKEENIYLTIKDTDDIKSTIYLVSASIDISQFHRHHHHLRRHRHYINYYYM